MDTMESCVPPGFRFHPTDEELVGYYLKKKVASQKIDLDVIRDVDLYRIEPWDLTELCRIGYEEQTEWYFFSHKDKKYPTGTRTNRATMAGFWKATGRDKAVHDKKKLIGMRKTLVFYMGRAPNGHKSDWIMHEYRLENEDSAPAQEEGWVVCRAFKKRPTCQTSSNIDSWNTRIFTTSIMDHSNVHLKQESELETNLTHLLHYPNTFIQLPQLESPRRSLPLLLKPNSSCGIATMPSRHDKDDDNENVRKSGAVESVVTDWRALDKFVASQLSQEEGFQVADFTVEEEENGEDMSLLLLQNVGEEEGKTNGRLPGSASVDDMGFCIFDQE